MIDVWMIFTMTFPLFEVTLHTYKESLKKDLNQSAFSPTRPKVAKASVVPGKGKRFFEKTSMLIYPLSDSDYQERGPYFSSSGVDKSM